jgi:hypothetical protein
MHNANDYIDPDELLRRKTLYNLHVYSKTDEGHVYLAFHANEQQAYVQDRVMPGETLREAMKRKLRESLRIESWRMAHGVGLADISKDSRGKETLTVDVYVLVPYFDIPDNKKVDGLHPQWISAE